MAYTGPGDVVSGAIAWWGLRGYSAAYSTGANPAIDVVDTATGLITTTINILSSGDLDDATILGLGYAVSITKFYDQTGNGNHLTQSTLANMPGLVQNPTGLGTGREAAHFDGSAFYLSSVSSIAQSQPYTVSTFVNVIDAQSLEQKVFFTGNPVGTNAFLNGDGGNPPGGPIFPYINAGGSNLDGVSIAINTFFAAQGIFNGASSDFNKDGTSNTGTDIGSTAMSGSVYIGARGNLIHFALAYICEIGVWPSAFSSGTSSSMSTNQHNFWGSSPAPPGAASLVFQAQTLAIPLITTANIKIILPPQ